MINTLANLPPEVQVSCEDALLSVSTPGCIMNVAALRSQLKAKSGTTIRYSRYERLPTAPVPLGVTGAPIPGTALVRTDIDATISYYGQYIALNQQVTLSNQDNVLMEISELLGLSLRMTEDQLTKNMLEASASVYRCTAGANGDLPTNLTLPDLDQVSSALMSNNAWMIFDRIGGENKFGTGPTRNAFLALGHTDLSKDLNNLNDFISQWNYPRDNGALKSEWGAVNNIRFLLSSVASKLPYASELGNTLYNVFVQGLESLANVQQDNFSSSFIFRPAIYSDPLAQNVTSAWTTSFCPKILNDLWITAVQCTLS